MVYEYKGTARIMAQEAAALNRALLPKVEPEPEPDTDALQVLIGTAVYGFMRAMMASGMDPVHAARVAAFAIVEGSLGREVSATLGIPRQTRARWRRDIANASEGGASVLDDPQLELDMLNQLLPAMGFRDLRVHRDTEHG